MTSPLHDDEQKRAAARIDELETRLAQQDQSLLELGDELYRQQRQIARLETELRQLVDRLQALSAPDPASNPADEIPPHY
jgi:SlyX protein